MGTTSMPGADLASIPSKPAERARSSEPLRVHPDNPRYFTDGSGRAIYLTGSYTWLDLQDGTLTGADLTFDYEGFLDFLGQHKHSFFRLWTWESSLWILPDSRAVELGPLPFQRTGPGVAFDGKPKLDLTRFDPAYFQRLRRRVESAQNRGVYVGVMLFQGFSVARKSKKRQKSPWQAHPFNVANNINGIDGDLNGDGEGYETHTLALPHVTRLQEAYVRKVIDTISDLDNVIYEISNESHGDSARWQSHMIDLIHEYERGKPKQHPVWMSFTWDGMAGSGKDADLFDSPAEAVSPRGESTGRGRGAWTYAVDPPVADGSKVVITDTDHLWGVGGDAKWVWKSFCRGLNPIFMDPYKNSPLHIEAEPEVRWQGVRRAMGVTARWAERIDLAHMTPTADPAECTTRYCLRNSSAEVLAYQPGAGSFSVGLAAGTYRYEWFDPTANRQTGSGRFDWPGGRREFRPPFNGPAVLRLKTTDTPTTHLQPEIP
ncbi:MAG: DUF6298 domain-containing protein [Planctomycetota bacterium]|nr:DUF6298 domain-containing protein [Planctomycetota bacterium]